MPSLKDVKMKIVGVGKTKQITKAMNMVASAKLRGAQAKIERFRPYADKYRQVIGELAGNTERAGHPLLDRHEEDRHCAIIIITSDRGLCGSFNSNIIQRALSIAREKKSQGKEVTFICIGRKGRDAARKAGYKIERAYADCMGGIDFPLAMSIGEEAIAGYENHAFDEVWLVYGQFLSMGQQPPVAKPLLPLSPPKVQEDHVLAKSDYVYEPDENKLLSDLLPRYINVQIYSALLDTSASEHAARMAAMDNATRNCNEMIQTLTLLYNKTRQATITSELIDIVGGAEALNG